MLKNWVVLIIGGCLLSVSGADAMPRERALSTDIKPLIETAAPPVKYMPIDNAIAPLPVAEIDNTKPPPRPRIKRFPKKPAAYPSKKLAAPTAKAAAALAPAAEAAMPEPQPDMQAQAESNPGSVQAPSPTQDPVLAQLSAPSATGGLTPSGKDGAWTVNFKDADLESFVQQISVITGENYILPSQLTGKVNVTSQTPLGKAEIKELMGSMLKLYGYSVVKMGKLNAIQPSDQARKFDIPIDKYGTLHGQQFVASIVPVKYAAVADLVAAMQVFMSEQGVIKPFTEVNALLIADTADNVRKVIHLIEAIDTADNQSVDIIPLQHNLVGNLMPLLEKLAPRELSASAKPGYSPIRIVADERSNVIMVRGEDSERLRMRSLIQGLDKPAEENAGYTQVLHLQNADAKETAELLKDFIKTSPDDKGGSGLVVKADPSINALVVRAPRAVINEIEQIIRQIDIPRAQVLIEAVIVEVSDDVSNSLGVQFGTGDAAAKASLAATSFDTAVGGAAGINLAGFLQSLEVPPANAALLSNGLTGAFGSRGSFMALVKALASTSKANLLSTPSIATLDNVEAKIVVGQNVPFRTGSFSTVNAGATNPFTTIERQDVGITLKVTPQVSSDNHIRLKVEQEVSSLQDSSLTGAADIITNKRTINTTILAENGGTVVLGGLISNDATQIQNKVPLLGDIPVVGELFQSNTNVEKKRNLLVFLRPTVMRTTDDIAQINQRKFDGLWELYKGDLREIATNDLPLTTNFYNPPLRPSRSNRALPWLGRQ